MGIFDKFMSAANWGGDDDDYDDYDDDYEEDPEPRGKYSKGREPQEKAAAPSKVTPMRQSGTRKLPSGMEVCVVKPTTFDDAREITDTLLANRTVVLNLEGLNVDIAQRIIDFTSGSTYAIAGNLQKISQYIFIITPHSVDISGDFPEIALGGGVDVLSVNKSYR